MHSIMATRTKCNQIFFRIIAGVAAELFVVDLEIRPGAAQIDISSHHAVVRSCGAVRIVRNQAAGEAASVGPDSRRFLGDVMQECLPLFAGEELEEP